MGRDNHPKERQARQLERKLNRRASYDRILIVCEGSKTEPNYFEEIRISYRLQTANVEITHSLLGTEPIQIVQYAEQLFLNGDAVKGIKPRSFEKVYVVFDRDEHRTYFNALGKVASLNKIYQNDLRKFVPFEAIVSIPSFEFWLLLHYEDIKHLIHRDEALQGVKRNIPGYEKGNDGTYGFTVDEYDTAKTRAERLAELSNPHDDSQPYTNVHKLVDELRRLKG
jgi:hypothetical protein